MDLILPAGIALWVILLIFGIPLILFLWALIDALTSDFKDSTTKLLWVLVIIFLPFIGSLVYLLVGRKQKV